MKSFLLLLLIAATVCLTSVSAQELYYPPNTGDTWETTDPAELGWCMDQLPALLAFLEENETKAFIILKDGRIAMEHYFGSFTADSNWYWASAGKGLTAFLTGMAQQEGLLDIDQPTSTYLGPGWTALTTEQEEAITPRHQLTMTTGLDDGTGELDCTDPECLQYLAPPGDRWSYHNAPYTLLTHVIESVSGQTLNGFLLQRLTLTMGLSAAYLPIGDNRIVFSRPRQLARFGLLMQTQGNWDGNAVMTDQAYFESMVTQSQQLNEAYGYLWWLNGQSSFMVPSLQTVFPGPLMPDAPAETFSALGLNAQILNVVPSQGLVVVRMGDLPGGFNAVPTIFNNEIWQLLNAVICTDVGVASMVDHPLMVVPNPAADRARLIADERGGIVAMEACAVDGRWRPVPHQGSEADLRGLATGTWLLRIQHADGSLSHTRLVVSR